MQSTNDSIRCKFCGYTQRHPFILGFIQDVCIGCITHEEKNKIDWSRQRTIFLDTLSKYKNNSGRYDCIVPVVGDAEDFYTVNLILELGLSPLLVTVNDYFKNDIGWKNLHTLITNFDLDSVCFNPCIFEYKELIRTSFRKESHVHLPWLYLHTAYPVHVALEKNIKLVIWGQHQAIEQVGKFSHYDQVEMSKWSRREHDTLGVKFSDFIGTGAQIDEKKTKYYRYPEIRKISQKNIVGVYLSNFFRWDPLTQNMSTLDLGFTPQQNSATYDCFERSGSSTYYKIHDLLKLSRHGYRKVNDHIARDLRHGHISLEESRQLLDFYTDQKIYVRDFFNWLDVTQSGYEWLLKHRLSNVTHLITDERTESPTFLPSIMKKLKGHITKAQEHFIPFGKGI